MSDEQSKQSTDTEVALLRSSINHIKKDLGRVDKNFEKVEENFSGHDTRITAVSDEQIKQAGIGAQTALGLKEVKDLQKWMFRGLILMLLAMVGTLITMLISR